MKRLFLMLTAAMVPEKVGCTTDELLLHVHEIAANVRAAKTFPQLYTQEKRLKIVAEAFTGVRCLNYHINRLNTQILIKRCELVSQRYPELEA